MAAPPRAEYDTHQMQGPPRDYVSKMQPHEAYEPKTIHPSMPNAYSQHRSSYDVLGQQAARY